MSDHPRPAHVSSGSSHHSSAAVEAELRRAGCVFAEDEAGLLLSAGRTPAELAGMIDRRVAGEPLEHILGWVEFCGLRLRVDPGVFVPRRRTELLVSAAAALVTDGTVVVDLCCGSGAVGAALLTGGREIELYAVDVDLRAVRCARHNIGSRGQVYPGDLDAPLPPSLPGQVDLVVANVPYVPTDEIGSMPPEARWHEPRVALDGGVDGLDMVRRVTDAAVRLLAPGGQLLVETSASQAPVAMDVFADHGLIPRHVRSERLDATVVVGSRG